MVRELATYSVPVILGRTRSLGYSAADDLNPGITLRTLNHGNCGIFLVMGNAGFISVAVV